MTSKKEILVVVIAAIVIGGAVKLWSGVMPKAPIGAMDRYIAREDTTLVVDVASGGGMLVHSGSPTTEQTATWHYLWDLGNPPKYPTGWNQAGFDPEAAGWKKAQANFGLNESQTLSMAGGQLPPLNTIVDVKTPTELYRTTFDLGGIDPAGVRFLQLRYAGNDGIVVYINGTAVVAENMDFTVEQIRMNPNIIPAGYLVSKQSDDPTVFMNALIDVKAAGVTLTPTGNIVAAQIHQDVVGGPASGDRAFDLSLSIQAGLLANDADESKGAVLSVGSHTEPVNARGNEIDGDQLQINREDGTFSYTPAPNFDGTVTFEYTAVSTESKMLGKDLVENTSPILVTIDIENFGSKIADDTYTIARGRELAPKYAVNPKFPAVIESGTIAFAKNRNQSGLGSEWKILPLSNGANSPKEDYPSGWNRPDFDDSSWDAGRAPFAAVGEGTTPIPGFLEEMGNTVTPLAFHKSPETGATSHTTYLFRTQVEFDENVNSLTIGQLVDDGAVLYLNGVEIWRLNMKGSPSNVGDGMSVSGGFPSVASTDHSLVNVADQVETDIYFDTVDLGLFPFLGS